MDEHQQHNRTKSRRETTNTTTATNPSFSSTLLDAIYRSIDESNGKEEQQHGGRRREDLFFYKDKKTMMTKTTSKEKKVVYRRRSMEDFERKMLQQQQQPGSSSSSSDSSSGSGGGFSSSESDSFLSASYLMSSRPRHIRTSVSTGRPERYEKVNYNSFLYERNNNDNNNNNSNTVAQKSNGFVKTKSKAMKIYSDLKKVKQPISPGGRLASFLNSLFNTGNVKKGKIKTTSSNHTSACSSASSFSRSCLSNTPSSRGNNGAKRSVRFYPVSVIVDEDSRPCGHKNLYENENDYVLSENRRVAEAARELLKNYRKKEESTDMVRGNSVNGRLDRENDEDDDDDDAASYASSDLFELDSIGIERYREELPVYETTHLDTNRAIASGLIL